jgi:hypothetical protein
MAGADVVGRVYGLEDAEVRTIIVINDEGGPERPRRLSEALRNFCPVCTRLDDHRERRIAEALRSEE